MSSSTRPRTHEQVAITKRGFPLRYSWLLAGRGFRGSGDAGPQHLVVTRFQEYQDGNPLSPKTALRRRC